MAKKNSDKSNEFIGLLDSLMSGAYYLLRWFLDYMQTLGPIALIFIPLLDLMKAYFHKQTINPLSNSMFIPVYTLKAIMTIAGLAVMLLVSSFIGGAVIAGANLFMGFRALFKVSKALWEGDYVKASKQFSKGIVTGLITAAFVLVFVIKTAPMIALSLALSGMAVGVVSSLISLKAKSKPMETVERQALFTEAFKNQLNADGLKIFDQALENDYQDSLENAGDHLKPYHRKEHIPLFFSSKKAGPSLFKFPNMDPSIRFNKLGEGNFGGVKRHITVKGKVFAVKRAKCVYPVDIQMFNNEVLMLQKLNRYHSHGTVLKIFARMCKGYLAMEYYGEDSLEKCIEKDLLKQLSSEQTLTLMISMADQIKMVHDNRILHNDIKPGNFMLIKDQTGIFQEAKIIDFGGAVFEGLPVGAFSVTQDYVAPEVSTQGGLSRKSDIYSLGKTFQEMMPALGLKNAVLEDLFRRMTHIGVNNRPNIQGVLNVLVEEKSNLALALTSSITRFSP